MNDHIKSFHYFPSADINECDEGLDGCHQICTNTNGSFECSCRPEFVLQSDQSTCNGILSIIKSRFSIILWCNLLFSVSPNSICPPNNVCEQVCFLDNVNRQAGCSCLPGYQLDSNNINCSGKMTNNCYCW